MAYRSIDGVGDVFKIIGASICSLIVLALSGWFFYLFLNVPDYELNVDTNITRFGMINSIYEHCMKCMEKKQMALIMGGIVFLVGTLFSAPIDYLLEVLPLGKFKDFNIGNSFITRSIKQIAPARIMGLYIAIHVIVANLIPSKVDFCVTWLLPITALIALSIFIAHIVAIVMNGGIWGVIIRLPLLFAENIGLALLFGLLGGYCLLLIIVLALCSGAMRGTSRAAVIASLSD